MQLPVVIIGSGFAGYQLARELRLLDQHVPVIIVTDNSGDDYSKPLISHGFSRNLSIDALRQKSCQEMAEELNITIIPNTRITGIDVEKQSVIYEGGHVLYRDLILATGAEVSIPPINGDGVSHILTLNSLDEYSRARESIADKQRILVIGTGLVGTEIAFDLILAGKDVRLVGMTEHLMEHLLPEFVSRELQQRFEVAGGNINTGKTITRIDLMDTEFQVVLSGQETFQVDAVIAATGLKPRTALAAQAGVAINRGICVDQYLETSQPHIYALGDGAEINGLLMPYLQPISLSAKALAKTLTGSRTDVVFSAMPVIVKTPDMPIHLSGETSGDHLNWDIEKDDTGTVARAYSPAGQMVGYIATANQISKSFALLAQLRAAA